MVAIGVGGADAVDVMTGFPFNVRWPKVIGVRLTGSLSGWSSPKDVILEVARVLTVSGGTGAIVEYFGPGADSISATGKATICNMGAEIGATCSIFPYDQNMALYLKATGREAIADAADHVADDLRPDDGATYDQLIEIDLDQLKPLINGPHSPDRAHRVGADVTAAATGERVAARHLIGPDRLVHELVVRGHHPRRLHRPAGGGEGAQGAHAAAGDPRLRAGPGHHRARRPARRPRGDRRRGAGQRLRAVHRSVGAHRPGSVAAQHHRQQLQPQLPEAQRRQRQHAVVRDVARHRRRAGPGRHARLRPQRPARSPTTPARRCASSRPSGRSCPTRASTPARAASSPRPTIGSGTDVAVDPSSDRLQLLAPFEPWDGQDYLGLPVLMKAQGKCTTDHISAAGKWLTLPRPPREHLRATCSSAR